MPFHACVDLTRRSSYLDYRKTGCFIRLDVHSIFIHERPDLGVVYGDPGPGTGSESTLEVLNLLDVEDNVEAQHGAGQGGGPGVVVVPGDVGVEGETISKLGAELPLEITEENKSEKI